MGDRTIYKFTFKETAHHNINNYRSVREGIEHKKWLEKKAKQQIYKDSRLADEKAFESLRKTEGMDRDDVTKAMKEGYFSYHRKHGMTDREIQKALDREHRAFDNYHNKMQKGL